MELHILPNGYLQIDGARITHKNFRGEGTPFNREGDRNFSLIIDDEEIANALREEGWNVKIKPPREDGELPFMFLPVKVSCNARGPKIHLESGRNHKELDESEFGILDEMAIASVDLDIRPYDWGPINGKYGRSAYLQGMVAVQRIADRFASRYTEE